jgi:hypothetical protein
MANATNACTNFSRLHAEPAFLADIDFSTSVEQFQNAQKQYPNYKFTDSVLYGKHALQYAADSGNLLLAKYILDQGGKYLVNIGDDVGRTALYFACSNRDEEDALPMVRWLIDCRADVNIATTSTTDGPSIPFGSTPLWAALHKAKNVALTSLLLQHRATVAPDLCNAAAREMLKQAQQTTVIDLSDNKEQT